MAQLLEAILSGATSERIKNLIDNGADVNIPTTWYPLDAAVRRNNARIVQIILKHVDYDINISSLGDDNNLLQRACSSTPPRVGIVRGLLEHGISASNVNYGETPLHLACQTGNKAVVKLLLDYGADVNYSVEDESTPLAYAIFGNYTRIVDLLLRNGAEIYPNILGDEIETNINKLLIKHAANLNSQTKYNWTKLSSAILYKKFDLAKELFEQGQDVDMLCLYAAVVCGNEEILQFIWSNIAPELVSNDLNFMFYVFESFKKDELCKFCLFLNRENIDLHLERCGKVFAYFMCRIIVWGRATSYDYYHLINLLVKRGLRLLRSDAEHIISKLSGPAYNLMVISVIIQHIIDLALPSISFKAFVDSIRNKCDKHFLQYCLEANSTLYGNYIFLRDVDSWQYYLGYFTVPHENKDDVIDAIKKLHSAEESEYLSIKINGMNVKSLKELSRDTIREWLSKICTDSRHLLHVLDTLKLSVYIRNVIQCKEPVNL